VNGLVGWVGIFCGVCGAGMISLLCAKNVTTRLKGQESEIIRGWIVDSGCLMAVGRIWGVLVELGEVIVRMVG
jgi:hypothetical protein